MRNIVMSDTTLNQLQSQLNGSFDALSVAEVRPLLDALTEQDSGDVQLDLAQIDFIDSSGIGALVFLYKRLHSKSRKLSLTGVKGQPLELLKFLRIDRSITIV
jgi:stage II sporulation protein AA (anti-sigma F factor antagonist)